MKQMFSWNSLAFCMIHQMLAICSLVPLPFYKPRLYISKFPVHVLLKPCLKDFEHNLTSMWNEYNCMVAWTFFGITHPWYWNENWPFPVLWPLLSFPNLLIYWVQHFSSITFRIWNNSAGIPSPPLALFIVMLPQAHLTSHSRKSGSRWVTTPSWSSGSLRSFLYSSSVYYCQVFPISSASHRSLRFLSLILVIPTRLRYTLQYYIGEDHVIIQGHSWRLSW